MLYRRPCVLSGTCFTRVRLWLLLTDGLAKSPEMVESTDFSSFAARPDNPAETQPVTPGFYEQVVKGL